MSKAATANHAGNGDAVQVNIGGALVRKLMPWLVGAGVAGGGGYVKVQHDADIQALKAGQTAQAEKLDRLDGKVELVVDLLKAQRRR